MDRRGGGKVTPATLALTAHKMKGMPDPSTTLDEDTIAAIATSPGRGGVGIVRLSGVQAFAIAQQLIPLTPPVLPRVARHAILRDADATRVDDALVTYFVSPHSYTGEDVVEIATHGSPVVLDWLLRKLVDAGAKPARAGEFTERAFLHGRMDLTEAEAVRDLIDAQTLEQAKQAAQQMGGSIAAEVRPTKRSLIELIAALEAGIDFAEDDIDTMPASEMARRIAALQPSLRKLLASFSHGRLLREGMRLAIVGKPNAGKSSLFNRLVQRERAIVTATPGTTRDVITEQISLSGVPVELLDTAGLRETDDEAERIGVERSREAIAEADAILLVLDASQSRSANDHGDLEELLRGRPVIVVHNKIDLLRQAADLPDSGELQAQTERNDSTLWDPVTLPGVNTSTVSGEGIAALRAHLLSIAQAGTHSSAGGALTNLRQHDAVSRASAALTRARQAVEARTPHEMVLLDLYECLHALDELTGETTSEDVLNLIFSTFCIGK